MLPITSASCKPGASVFGISDNPVYPKCVSRAKTTAFTQTENQVFSNVARYLASISNNSNATSDPANAERDLARSLGLSQSFDVPWMYVASKAGAIAVFPGTAVIADPKWNISSRPWFMAAFGGEAQLESKGLYDTDLLTVPYLDVLAKSSILVRTYINKFSMGQEQFLVAIDFHLRDEATAEAPVSTFTAVAAPDRIHLVIALLSTLLIFSIIRSLSIKRLSTYVFIRAQSSYGMLNAKRNIEVRADKTRDKQITRGVQLERFPFVFKLLDDEHFTASDTNTTEVEKVLSGLRGLEWWNVSYEVASKWRLLWLKFESVTQQPIGELQLAFSSAILPEASWASFNNNLFSQQDEQYVRDKLARALKAGSHGSIFLVPDSDPAILPEGSAGIPNAIQAVVGMDKLLAVRQARAYVSLTGAQLSKLYSEADNIRAVMLSSYFQELLEHDDTEFLCKGNTIFRLVSFPTESSNLDLSDKAQEVFDSLKLEYADRSRRLARANDQITLEDNLARPYDFVIVREKDGSEYLVVAHDVSTVSRVDRSSGSKSKVASYGVEAYISWREADLAFYREVFSRLASSSVDVFH